MCVAASVFILRSRGCYETAVPAVDAVRLRVHHGDHAACLQRAATAHLQPQNTRLRQLDAFTPALTATQTTLRSRLA